MAYNQGGTDVFRSHNFVSSQELHKPHIQNKLTKRFNETLTGFLDLAGAKAPTDNIEYSRFEKNRVMPKIKATNGGAGAAGATVQFTVHADAKNTFGSYSPYDTGVSGTTTGITVRLNDTIQIRPATGLASAGSYIDCIVVAVAANKSTFDAKPMDSTDAIPSIAAAQEIIITGNAYGEGTGYGNALSTKVTKYDESLQIVKHKYEVTGTEKLQALWIDDDSKDRKAFLPGEADGYLQFLNFSDLTLLVGKGLASTALSELFVDGTLGDSGASTTNGAITQALDGGNTLNYSNITGVTLSDLYDYNTVIDKESADKENMVNLGIDIDQQLDRELGDRVTNGAISYGTFNFDQEKAINLNFSKVRLGSFTYHKRTLACMNDKQTLGADGYGYSYEGLMLPLGMSKVAGGSEAGAIVPTLRKRYLANKGQSREMEINYFEGLKHSDTGVDKDEVRYQGHCGAELQAKNKSGYWKRA